VYIGDIWGAKSIFKYMDTLTADGHQAPKVDTNGFIRGLIFHKSGLVGYWLWINLKSYGLVKIIVVPQNPNKRRLNKRLSMMSKRARSGYRILWVMLDESNGNVPKMIAKMETAPTEINWNPFGTWTYQP